MKDVSSLERRPHKKVKKNCDRKTNWQFYSLKIDRNRKTALTKCKKREKEQVQGEWWGRKQGIEMKGNQKKSKHLKIKDVKPGHGLLPNFL